MKKQKYILLFIIFISLISCDEYNRYDFFKIKNGMSFEEVISILGKPLDKQLNHSIEAWQYSELGFALDKYTIIWFDNEKVIGLTNFKVRFRPSHEVHKINWNDSPFKDTMINLLDDNIELYEQLGSINNEIIEVDQELTENYNDITPILEKLTNYNNESLALNNDYIDYLENIISKTQEIEVLYSQLYPNIKFYIDEIDIDLIEKDFPQESTKIIDLINQLNIYKDGKKEFVELNRKKVSDLEPVIVDLNEKTVIYKKKIDQLNNKKNELESTKDNLDSRIEKLENEISDIDQKIELLKKEEKVD